MSAIDYPPPVNRLLTYGDCRDFRKWPDYVSELNLGPEHIPDLVRMATDMELNLGDGDSLEVWAPTHAWRALGQLRAEAAIGPLLHLIDELEEQPDDWALEELPTVYGMIGPAALPALSAYLADRSHKESSRIAVTEGIRNVGEEHPDVRDECVEILTRQLERFRENEKDLNGSLVYALVALNALESVPVIKRAFAANRVDESVQGDWEDAQIELGLKPFREAPRRPSFFGLENRDAVPSIPDDSETFTERKARQTARNKRKQARKSRKANRKKKKK